jgi:uncharacterized membrane protein (UPF0136 family)
LAEIARDSVLALSIFMLAGGIMGFVRAKSKASLIAGVVSGILLAACFAVALSNAQTGLIGALVVSLLLDVVFGIRLQKTKKFMPSGMLLAVNVIVQIIIISALVTAGSSNPPG